MRSAAPGRNVLRYLMLRMHNQILKAHYHPDGCSPLSELKLPYGCIPFDNMPLCTSLPGHNPRCWDLLESLDVTGRNHELLARLEKNNVERHGILYTPVVDLEEFGVVNDLISTYNNKLYSKHAHRRLVLHKEHVLISGYEEDTVCIVNKLQEYASSGISATPTPSSAGFTETSRGIDDSMKEDALKQLFSQSRVAPIDGAAGTGK